MRPIDVNQIKRAVKYGQLEFFVNKGFIYVNDSSSGNCLKLGTVKGEPDNEEDGTV